MSAPRRAPEARPIPPGSRPARPGPPPGRPALALLALALPLALGACDHESLTPPEPPAGDLYRRYVALGNSITAGFQSGGINDSTQARSYSVFLAEELGTPFEIPSLRRPGCPPPLVNVFTGERVGGGAVECALRRTPPPPFLNNVAVPGAAVLDALRNLGPETSANALTTLLLGGRTQLEAAAEVLPTFASVWLGNNDVLAAGLTGDPSRITPVADFTSRYATVLDSLESVAAEEGLEGVLVGVADVTLAPYLSPGAAYFAAEQQGALPPDFDVANSCAPAGAGGVGESTFVPFPYGIGVLLSLASRGQSVTLDCADNRDIEEIVGPAAVPDDVEGTSLLVTAETRQVVGAVQAYNQAIQAEAEERGWAHWNPNPLFRALVRAGEIPLFPDLVGPEATSEPFGPMFSKDGVHPSTAAHRIVADSLASVVEARYGGFIALD